MNLWSKNMYIWNTSQGEETNTPPIAALIERPCLLKNEADIFC